VTQTSLTELPDDVEAAARRLLETASRAELRLATAESCTGGLVASILTDVEGASHTFERGFVVYSDEAKQQLLGVDPGILARDGAVSRACAVAMAEGALGASPADLAVALTGYAGPGGGDDAEEGLVHLACARRGRPTVHREAHFGALGRSAVRLEGLRAALEMLEEAIR
jgi:nicotinamide-nucleotide amidase